MVAPPAPPGQNRSVQPVILLHASLRAWQPYAWEAALLETLPYAKRTDLGRRRDEVRRASLAGIALALLGASELTGAPVAPQRLRFPSRGRPLLDGGPAFSVSHAAGRVACLVAGQGAPGLDLEWLGEDEDPARTVLLRRWTAVEAVLKAGGEGLARASGVRLAADLRQGELEGIRYGLRELRLAGRWIAHVAAGGTPRVPVVREVDLAAPAVSASVERCVGLAAQVEQARSEA